MMRPCVGIGVVLALGIGIGYASAQIVVSDPAVTARNAVIAAIKDHVVGTLTTQATQLRKMARRLSASASLDRYVLTDIPMWRIHVWFGDQFLYANPYNAALTYGDGNGTAFEKVARERQDATAALATFGEDGLEAEAAIRAQLATLDAADSTIIASTDQTGQLRYNGRRELAAIDALEHDTVDPSPTQSATAVLDKISGAEAIRARQQQARIQFLAGIVEQLLVDNKRSRDTEAATMNMQLARLRYGQVASTSLVVGAANDLRTWRQP